MPYPPQEQELRQKAFPWLPGSDFDDALAEAKDYHEKHPPLELLGVPSHEVTLCPEHVELLEREKDAVAENNKETIAKLLKEHREKVMLPFLQKMVPEDLAGEIADKLVLDP